MKLSLKHIVLVLILCFFVTIFFLHSFSYLYQRTKEAFLDTNYEKTIYLIWRNKTENSTTNYGFGDKLRGAIFLHQYCKKNKINLKIDATDDICSDFLKNVVSDDYSAIKEKPTISLGDETKEDVYEKIEKELHNNDTIYVFSNGWPDDLDNDDISFGKFICEPKEFLNLEINEKIRDLPLHFGIQHFRFNDRIFENDVDSNDKLFSKYFDILKSSYKPTDVLFSNSNNFKKYAKEQLGIKTIDCNSAMCKIQHIGKSTDNESVKNSFIEFFIISRSSYVKSHTCYYWPSNFVHWPYKIYNIPFENVYIDETKL